MGVILNNPGFTYSELEAYCSKFYQGRRLLITPYAYVLTFSALAAAGSATQTLSIAANADFVLTHIHYHANVAAAGQTVATKTVALARMLVTDSGSNEQFTSAAVDLENYAANSFALNSLDYPRIISGRSTLTVQMSNYDAAQTYNIDVSFSGVLVRAYSN